MFTSRNRPCVLALLASALGALPCAAQRQQLVTREKPGARVAVLAVGRDVESDARFARGLRRELAARIPMPELWIVLEPDIEAAFDRAKVTPWASGGLVDDSVVARALVVKVVARAATRRGEAGLEGEVTISIPGMPGMNEEPLRERLSENLEASAVGAERLVRLFRVAGLAVTCAVHALAESYEVADAAAARGIALMPESISPRVCRLEMALRRGASVDVVRAMADELLEKQPNNVAALQALSRVR